MLTGRNYRASRNETHIYLAKSNVALLWLVSRRESWVCMSAVAHEARRRDIFDSSALASRPGRIMKFGRCTKGRAPSGRRWPPPIVVAALLLRVGVRRRSCGISTPTRRSSTACRLTLPCSWRSSLSRLSRPREIPGRPARLISPGQRPRATHRRVVPQRTALSPFHVHVPTRPYPPRGLARAL